jgi:phospholipid/cholesterol/gamma-HCH transport system ATP-binding protein
MEVGDHIIYMDKGLKEWEGNNKEIIFSKNDKLNAFIFASEFLKDAKDMRMLEVAGKIDNDRDMNELMNNPGASPFIDNNK